MSGEFDSSKDSHSTKFERRPRIFVKLRFRELCGSKLSGLHPFVNTNQLTAFTIDWFLYHGNIGLKKVNLVITVLLKTSTKQLLVRSINSFFHNIEKRSSIL